MTCCCLNISACVNRDRSSIIENRQILRRLFCLGLALSLSLLPAVTIAQPTMLSPSQQHLFSNLFSDPDTWHQHPTNASTNLPDQFITLNARFFALMTTESEIWVPLFHHQAEKIINEISNSDTTRCWSYLIASQTALYQALANYHFGNSWKAFFKMQEAKGFMSRQEKSFPSYLPNKKMEALFNVLWGSIPDDYQKIAAWFGFKGDRKKGWQQLLQYGTSVQEQPGWHEEWLMWTGFIALKLDLNPPQYTLEQNRRIQESPLLAFLVGWKQLKQHDPKRCLWYTQRNTPEFPLINYVRGMALLSMLQYQEALMNLENFRNHFSGNSYQADALRRCAWISLLTDHPEQARLLRLEVQQLPAPSSMDKEATRACEQDPLPNKKLLMARLLYDGGNYSKGILVLKDINEQLLTTEERVERHYRLGRLFLSNEQGQEAIPHLTRAFLLGANTGTGYQATYAALTLAQHYHAAQDFSKEAQWKRNCMKSNKGPYKQHVKQQLDMLSDQ